MIQDEIRVALENAVGVPEEAMRAAVQDPAALAPAVIAVARSMADGRLPLPPEERLPRFGLFVLAAARETSVCPALLALLRRPSSELEWLFGEDCETPAAQLPLSVFNGDAETVCALIADPGVDDEARAGLMQALARLVWEGRVSRERVLALLDQFDDEALAPVDSWAWFGWQEALLLLGATDRIERVQRGWEAGRLGNSFRDVDRRDWLEQTRLAAEHPDDPRRFTEAQLAAIDDPVSAVAWSADGPTGPGQPPSSDETAWLGVALLRSVPAGNRSMEGADGVLTALAAGPVRVPPAEYLPLILRAKGEAAGFDSPEHKALAVDLLIRHHDAIERRLAAGSPTQPWVDDLERDMHAVPWARGYVDGMALRQSEWAPLTANDRLAKTLLMPIVALLPDPEGTTGGALRSDRRWAVIRLLPEIALATRAFWQGKRHPLLDEPRERTPKVGRNEPCPCGSGKKYKKCCGAVA